MSIYTLDAARSGTFEIGGDLPVHRLGYGAMRITGDGVWGPPEDRDEAIAVLRRAVELGINLIDTAEAYGPGVSEELIHDALHPYPAGLVIATKGGFDRPGPGRWEVNGRPARLREELEGSLRRLDVERIDLWQLHRIDDEVPEEDQFGAIRDFIDEGKIRHVGLSEVTVEQIERAREQLPIVSVQNKYNMIEQDAGDVLAYCTQERLAFLPWNPLEVGELSKGAGEVGHVARKHDATAAQVALAWLLRRSSVMLPIPGTSSVEHLEENVGAASLRLDDEDMRRLRVGARGAA